MEKKNLLESYKGRLSVSEKYFAQKNEGAKMSASKKMLTAQCLDNVANYLNEAYVASAGNQRSDLGAFKTFCLDITTLTMPNLIVNDLFMVQPMANFQGYLTYMEYGLGEEKGGVGGLDANGEFNTITQNPFVWSPMTEARMEYTGQNIVEAVTAGATVKPAWGPVKANAFQLDPDDAAVKAYDAYLDIRKGFMHDNETVYAVKFVDASGNLVTYANLDAAGQVVVPAGAAKMLYVYDNQTIPQEKVPTMRGHMRGISLEARARRIAVEYSQFAAFQYKQDYNVDFEGTIAQQAQAELEYEIDSEAVFMIKNAADAAVAAGKTKLVKWVDEELDTISYSMKAEGFARKLEQAKMLVYKQTGRFMPNWMLVSPDMMPILTFVPGFQGNNASIANGPYVAGSIASMKVIVSPALGDKVCYLGVLGADGKSAVGVYAPYMPIVPTQLLGFNDGTMSQGFSTLYDMRILNPLLLAKIQVVDGNNHAAFDMFTGSEDWI